MRPFIINCPGLAQALILFSGDKLTLYPPPQTSSELSCKERLLRVGRNHVWSTEAKEQGSAGYSEAVGIGKLFSLRRERDLGI